MRPTFDLRSLTRTHGRSRYLPVMISRLMISLKKAAGTEIGLSFAEPQAGVSDVQTARFFYSREVTNGREDGILLDTYSRPQTAV